MVVRLGDVVEVTKGPLTGHLGVLTKLEFEYPESCIITRVTVRLEQNTYDGEVWTEKFARLPASSVRVFLMFNRVCKHGFTREELEDIVPDLDDFDKWMSGQTMMICDGYRYNYDTREYEPDCEEAHGSIVYVWDVDRYLKGLKPID